MRLIGDKLSSVRGGRTLFTDLAFDVPAGEALVVTGPNGSGKTSLLRTIAGLLPPATGRIRLTGAAAEQPVREQCHYIGHANALKAALTVAENAEFWARYLGGSPRRLDDALDGLGLSLLRDIPAGYLSAGQQRRLGLARLLLAHRPLWLLDEPATSLDSAAQELLTNAVNAHLTAGGIAVAATHTPLGFASAHSLHLGAATQAA